jgi:hypothetical protein
MSTEHQRYSTENPGDAIRQYAEQRSLEVVRTYADEGKSGPRLDGRDALQRLIQDVQTGDADFSTILVYDVTHWGRLRRCQPTLGAIDEQVSLGAVYSETDTLAGSHRRKVSTRLLNRVAGVGEPTFDDRINRAGTVVVQVEYDLPPLRGNG